MKKQMSTKTLVLSAVLTALIVLLQYLGGFIKLGPFSISLVLIPIVIGAATCGAGVGAWLGLVFGGMVFATGDAAAFLAVDVVGTILTVMVKGIACGYLAGLAYKGIYSLSKKRYLSVLVAAVVCPVVNTGIFLIGCLLFFMEPVTAWAAAAGLGEHVGQFMIVGLVGTNFLVELAVNLILSPVATRLLNIKDKQ